MSPRRVDKEEKKRQIAEAAVRIFSKKGYDNTTISEIASDADVGKGTVYEYFRSKDEVFGYAIDMFMLDMSHRLWEEMHDKDDPLDRLEALIDASFGMIQEAGESVHFLFQIWAASLRKGSEHLDLRESYLAYRDTISAVLADGMETGRFRQHDANLVASILIAALDGLALQWASDSEAIPPDRTAKELHVLVRHALLEQKPPPD